MTPVIFYIYYLFPHGTSINTKTKKSNVWILFFWLLQTNGEITPILNPGKKSNRRLIYVGVLIPLFNTTTKRYTINRGRHFFKPFLLQFPISDGSRLPGFGSLPYREKFGFHGKLGRKIFLHFLAKFIGILLHTCFFKRSLAVL